MKNSNTLNQYLFTGPENANCNQNFKNINLISLNNSNLYENNREKFIKTEISINNHNVSFCTKEGEKLENLDFSGNNRNTEVYDIYNETTSTNHKLFMDNANCTDVNIKNKIMNINSSLKSFFIHVKSKLISYADFENSRNKNSYISFLLDYIVDLLWFGKAEREDKNEFVQKLQSSNFKFEEYERKIKKLGIELCETKKYLNNVINKNLNEKEKNNFKANSDYNNKNSSGNFNNFNTKNFLFQSGKSFNSNYNNNGGVGNLESQFELLKAENKKLNSQINIFKNEIKKKEVEFSKLQEKLKKLLNEKIAIQTASIVLNNSFSNNNNFIPIGTVNINNNNNLSIRNRNNFNNLGNDIFKLSSFIGFDLSTNNLGNRCKKNFRNQKNENLNQLQNLYKKFLEFNTQNNLIKKYESLLNQNNILMGILFSFQESLDTMNQKVIYFNKNNTKIKTELLDLIKLKENIFSLHLIDKELLNEFSDNFLENIKLFEEIILRIMEFIFYENSEFKEKYANLEKEFVKANKKLPLNNIDNTINSNDNYSSKDYNYNNNNNHIEINNANGNFNNKEKDLIKNLKRWSIRATLNTPSVGKNIQRTVVRNTTFAARILENENDFEGKYNNYNYENENSYKFQRVINRKQSVNSVKFINENFK
jgi:hypothetical protein